MEITKTLQVSARQAWRKWLSEHYRLRERDLVDLSPQTTGKTRITYNDAVEEALCFGWIDSTQKRLDDDHAAQRFSPRNPKSPYSQTNIERAALAGSRMSRSCRRCWHPWATCWRVPSRSRRISCRRFRRCWRSPAYRIRVAYVDGARARPAEFQKRLKHMISRWRRASSSGMG